MKKILFPTDFSETSNNAFVYVLEMAKDFDAEVIVLHVYNLPPVSYEGYPIYVAEVFDTIELGKFENMKDQIPYLRKIAEDHQLDNIKMNHVLEEGDLVSVINRIVKKEEIDLIVMGTEGASGLKETFLGSNTGSVIESVPITLLSVPNKVKFSAIKKIAFTTRFRAKDHKALLQVIDFANRVNAKVKCLYVRTNNSDINENQIDKWREDFKNDPVEFIIIPDNDVEGTIFEFIDNEKIDILAMLTYKHGFFQNLFRTSFTKKLSYHSEIPILVFHEK
jgi:nucleotide-binding universal stress UspA family protein